MQKSTFDGVLRAIASETHPLQTNLQFIFTDFLPNKNKQGVSKEEANNLLRTGIDMPVKADFRRGKLGDHTFSMPVGHITAMDQSGDHVIGRAILYKDEFPDLTAYLEKASASDVGVHFSWELYHGSETIDAAGIQWLQDCVVAGVVIVANPAYAGRTHLLAMAGEEVLSDKIEELERQVAALTAQLSHNGSTSSMDPMEELKQLVLSLSNQLAALTAAVTQSLLEDAQEDAQEDAMGMGYASTTEETNTELTELRAFKETVETEKARAALLTTRRESLKDVLTSDEFEAKADFIAGLNDEQFKTYTESLTTVAQKNKQSASYRSNGIFPDPISSDSGQTSIAELGKALRELK